MKRWKEDNWVLKETNSKTQVQKITITFTVLEVELK